MITAYVNGVAYPPIELDFINQNLENAADVVTLDGSLYTDFTDNSHGLWSLQWDSLTETEYNAIRADYDAQFTNYQYPTLTIPHYGLTDVPVRMTINERSVWRHCGDVQNVQITFRETPQLPEVS
jgi:hypothetical protein